MTENGPVEGAQTVHRASGQPVERAPLWGGCGYC